MKGKIIHLSKQLKALRLENEKLKEGIRAYLALEIETNQLKELIE